MTKGTASRGWSVIPQRNMKCRVLWYTQAKVIGGGSTINAQIYTRGITLGYDAWAEAGKIDGEVETTGEVRLDDDKIGRMGFCTPPTEENRAIRKAEAENLSSDGAIWVTSPWKPSYLGNIG